jgi:RHS repeat-associated protein
VSVVRIYDHNGNLISYKGWSYSYDAQNRLTSASKGAHTALFHYDGKNRQIMRSIDGTVRFSVWDDWELLEKYDTSNVKQAAFLQGAHGVVKSLVNNIYYYQDKLGNTTHIADSNGNLLESYRYDLYGTPSYFDSTSQPINSSTYNIADLYAGERWVSELRVYDLRNRFMSPELGRFLQADPVGFQGDASNLYRYCHNNPEDFSDPMGLYDQSSDFWHNLTDFFNGNPSINSILSAWNSDLIRSLNNAQGQGPVDQGTALKRDFYGKGHGKRFDNAFRRRSGYVLKVPSQTFDNSPEVNTNYTDAQLGEMNRGSGMGKWPVAINRPWKGPHGTIYIAKETLRNPVDPQFALRSYAHELANIVDAHIFHTAADGDQLHERHFGIRDSNKAPMGDTDTGMAVEVEMFGAPVH